jgi:hypothetical protein
MAARWCGLLIAAACAHHAVTPTPNAPTPAPVDPALQIEIPGPPPLPTVPEADPAPTPVTPPPVSPARSSYRIVARVIATEVQGDERVVVISVGSSAGVASDWKAVLLEGDTDRPLPGGEVTLVRVARRQAVGNVHLTVDQVSRNMRVRLTPP